MSTRRRPDATHGGRDSYTNATQISADGKGPSGGNAFSRPSQLGQDGELDAPNHSQISGLSDNQLWLLLRRFDKEVFILRATAKSDDDSLDMQLSSEAEFSSNKLRSQLERLYLGVLLGLLAALKHLSRLQSWREPRRTGTFFVAYFIGWYFEQLFTLIVCVSIAMVLSARIRSTLFPPVPMSLVDWKTGGLTKPAAGVLASPDSATGAPENFRGEAVEKEAESFATTIAGIAVSVWTAQDEDTKPSNQDPAGLPASSLPRPHDPTTLVGIAMDKAAGLQDSSSDKTKQPMQAALWSVVLPWLRLLYTFSDTWERLANALDPTPPFPKLEHRLRLAGFLALLPVGSTFISLQLFGRAVAFCVGLWLFARPPLAWAVNWLDQTSPGWFNTLSVENHLLKGMPTNAQLAITLLRDSEDSDSPLPTTQYAKETPSNEPIPISPSMVVDTWDAPLGATHGEMAEAAAPEQSTLEAASGPSSEIKDTESHRPHKLLGMIKSGMKSTVKLAMKADQIRAKTGRQSAKNRIGVIPRKQGPSNREQGPWSFKARSDGKDGQLHINSNRTVSFNNDWTLHARDIKELKKHDGLGLKAKVVVGWAMEADVKDGLEIKDHFGKAYILTAVSQRDQAFRRLCAIGGQTWDVL